MKATLSCGAGWSLREPSSSSSSSSSAAASRSVSLLIKGGGPQTFHCVEDHKEVEFSREAGEVDPKKSCICRLELHSGGEGILKDIIIRSNSRIQEIYVCPNNAKQDEEIYVATCRGEREAPGIDCFISKLPPATSLRNFCRMSIKFLSLKGKSSDTLHLHQMSLVLGDLKMQPKGSKPSNVPQSNINPQTQPSMNPQTFMASVLGKNTPTPSQTTSSISSEYDTFTMFAMYKSMFMTEMSEMLDAKLSPISLQLRQLEGRVTEMQNRQILLFNEQHGSIQRDLREMKEMLLSVPPPKSDKSLSGDSTAKNMPAGNSTLVSSTEKVVDLSEGDHDPLDDTNNGSDEEVMFSEKKMLHALNVLQDRSSVLNCKSVAKEEESQVSGKFLSDMTVEIVRKSDLSDGGESHKGSGSLKNNTNAVVEYMTKCSANEKVSNEQVESEYCETSLKGDMRQLLGLLKRSEESEREDSSALREAFAVFLPPVAQDSMDD